LTRLSASHPEFFGEALESNGLLEAFGDGKLEIFADQGAVDTLLVKFNHRIFHRFQDNLSGYALFVGFVGPADGGVWEDGPGGGEG